MVGKVFSFSRQRGYGLFAITHRAETIARVHQLLDECPIDHRPGLKPFSNELKNCRVHRVWMG
jgi:hypothetical protein